MSLYCPFTYKGYPHGLNYPWKFPMPTEKERDRRWQAIRKAMAKAKYDCLIPSALSTFIPSTKYVHYISNYVPFATMGAYIVFPLEGESSLHLSTIIGPQFIQMATETSWIKDIVGSFNPLETVVKQIKKLKLEKGKLGILGYNQGLFSASALDYFREQLPSATITDASTIVHEAMHEVSRTSPEELSFLRKACEILDLSFDAAAKAFKPGVAEYELWAEIEYAILKNGGWPCHNMIITTAQKPIFPRIPPSHHKLEKGDVGIFEVNVSYGGLHPQTCYAISLGEPQKEVKEMYKLCEELYQFVLVELEKKSRYIDIELALANQIHAAGYEPTTPQIHIFNFAVDLPMESVPQPGDYFTVHPNLANPAFTASAKCGDCVRIDKNGKVERLNKPPARLNIV
jgi:Xaa-Pro aminopeptidase